MRTLINYIRSCFCKHEWECLAENAQVFQKGYENPVRRVWLYRCKKCGCKNQIILDGNDDERW
jgi:hypothetical protein